MKKFLAMLVLFLFALVVQAQQTVPYYTVATLPMNQIANLAIVMDGSSSTDCTVGGGTTPVLCMRPIGQTVWVNVPNSTASVVTATNLAAGALGSVPYQSAAGTTALVASPTTSGHTFVYSWQPSGSALAPAALDLATYLLTPPAIGGTTPAAGKFTTLSMSGMTSNSSYINSSVQVAPIVTSDWSCGTTGTVADCSTAQTVGTLSFTLPSSAKTWSFNCDVLVSQATGDTANYWDISTTSHGATNIAAWYQQNLTASTITTGYVVAQGSTTSPVAIGASWTLGATGTYMPGRIFGTIEGASASGTVVNIMLVAPTVGDLVTVYRGSACHVW